MCNPGNFFRMQLRVAAWQQPSWCLKCNINFKPLRNMLRLATIELMLCSTWNYSVKKVVLKKCYRNISTFLTQLSSYNCPQTNEHSPFKAKWFQLPLRVDASPNMPTPLQIYMNACVCFCFNLGLNPGTVPRTCPFWVLPFIYLFYLFMWCTK